MNAFRATGVFVGAAAAALAIVLTPLVRRLAAKLGAFDPPGARRVHAGTVPRLGGVAVLAAGLGALLLAASASLPIAATVAPADRSAAWLVLGVLIVTLTGVIDDIRELGPGTKLALQTVAALCALAGGYGFVAVTNPFTGSVVDLGSFGMAATLLWIVGVTNAFNLIDGLDGLAAGVGLIAAMTMLLVSLSQGRIDAALLSVALAGALAGFLCFNFPPASIFLGDSGSLLLGYLLSVISVQGLGKGPAAVVILVPVVALGLPITDTVTTVLRRIRATGWTSVMRPDREHIHHRLVGLGWSPRRAVVVLYAVSASFAALALLAAVLSGPGRGVLAAVVAGASYVLLRRLAAEMSRRRQGMRVDPHAP